MKVTYHAKSRFNDRFPFLSIEEELKNSVPFGAQLGTDTYYLSDNNVVFVVSKQGFVITTLTKDQAIANMNSKIKEFRDFSLPNIKPAKTPLCNILKAELTELAKRHAKKYSWNYDSKIRKKDVRASGFGFIYDVGNEELKAFYKAEFFKAERELMK